MLEIIQRSCAPESSNQLMPYWLLVCVYSLLLIHHSDLNALFPSNSPHMVLPKIHLPTNSNLFLNLGVMLMRAYAFTSRSRQILIILGLCYLFLVGFNLWVFCTPIRIHLELFTLYGPTGCYPDNTDGAFARRVGVSDRSISHEIPAITDETYSIQLFV
jgi:hypothetical protein